MHFIEAPGTKQSYFLKVKKPLHSVLKAQNYWFATYHSHHIKKLDMEQSIYNSYLLHDFSSFGIVSLEINYTLFLTGTQFITEKEKTIQETHLMLKNRKPLSVKKFFKFNGRTIHMTNKGILTFKQKRSIATIATFKGIQGITTSTKGINETSLTLKDEYLIQRA